MRIPAVVFFRIIAAAFLLSGSCVSAQSIGFGVKGGLRVTDDLSSNLGDATSESKRYVVGPMVTIGLPLGFTAEVDALYRRVAYRTAFVDIVGDFYAQRGTANSWEFPMLVRHKLVGGLYAGIGYAPRVISGSSRVNATTIVNPLTLPVVKAFSSYTLSDDYKTGNGLVIAGGLQKRFGAIRVSPEIRYTHWSNSALSVNGPQEYGYQSAQEQVDVLLGISFP